MTTTSTAAGTPAGIPDLATPCIPTSAPPCAQPLDSLHKHLYAALLVVMALLLYAINATPPEHELPPASCTTHAQQ